MGLRSLASRVFAMRLAPHPIILVLYSTLVQYSVFVYYLQYSFIKKMRNNEPRPRAIDTLSALGHQERGRQSSHVSTPHFIPTLFPNLKNTLSSLLSPTIHLLPCLHPLPIPSLRLRGIASLNRNPLVFGVTIRSQLPQGQPGQLPERRSRKSLRNSKL